MTEQMDSRNAPMQDTDTPEAMRLEIERLRQHEARVWAVLAEHGITLGNTATAVAHLGERLHIAETTLADREQRMAELSEAYDLLRDSIATAVPSVYAGRRVYRGNHRPEDLARADKLRRAL